MAAAIPYAIMGLVSIAPSIITAISSSGQQEEASQQSAEQMKQLTDALAKQNADAAAAAQAQTNANMSAYQTGMAENGEVQGAYAKYMAGMQAQGAKGSLDFSALTDQLNEDLAEIRQRYHPAGAPGGAPGAPAAPGAGAGAPAGASAAPTPDQGGVSPGHDSLSSLYGNGGGQESSGGVTNAMYQPGAGDGMQYASFMPLTNFGSFGGGSQGLNVGGQDDESEQNRYV